MRLCDPFNRTFVLNLPDRADRRREIEAVLTRAGMSWEPGKLELFPAVRPPSPRNFPSLGALGCFLSHLAMLKKARDLKLDRILVIEDDLEFSSALPETVPPIAHQLDRLEWDFAYLGHVLDDAPNPDAAPLVPFQGPITTTHFYAVHGRVFDRIIAFLESVSTRPEGHRTLVARPSLGWQRESRSDINGRWFDQIPATHALTGAARRVKRWLSRARH